jgi:pimeloyl-ACP methyl ester carboxylesterase
LHYVERRPAADERAPLAILLHGFPEFWYSWRHQIVPLADAGFRVVAPDMRGYNLSDKPAGVANYTVEVLADDVAQLIEALGETSATVIGHDWGGMVAWWFAMRHPRHLERLVILNCPHPGHTIAMMTDPQQLRRSAYILFFQIPRIPERRIARYDFAAIRHILGSDTARKSAFSEHDLDRYVAAHRHGSVSAMLAYYRALLRRNPWALARKLRPVEAPVQVIWGARDRHLGIEYATPPARMVRDVRIDVIDDASHWVQVDCPSDVNRLLLDFLPEIR